MDWTPFTAYLHLLIDWHFWAGYAFCLGAQAFTAFRKNLRERRTTPGPRIFEVVN